MRLPLALPVDDWVDRGHLVQYSHTSKTGTVPEWYCYVSTMGKLLTRMYVYSMSKF